MNNVEKAAETLISMCADFIAGGITQETFVANLEGFSKYCKEEHDAERDAERAER